MDLEELVKLRDEVLESASEFRKQHFEKDKALREKNEQVTKTKALKSLERQSSDQYWAQIHQATEPNETFKTHHGGYTLNSVNRPRPPPQAVLPYDPKSGATPNEVSDLY